MTTTAIPKRTTPHTGVAGPLILIGLGVLFLLSNLGMLTWNVWEIIFRFWPILLVAVGLDILIGRRSIVGSLLVMVITFVILGLGIWWLGPAQAGGTPLASQTINQPLAGAQRGEIELSLGVGTLQLTTMSEPVGLISGSIEARQLDSIVTEASIRGDTALYSLRYRENTSFGPTWGQDDHWNLQLNPQVPIALRINSGVGTARLDLSMLKVTDLWINAGVGQTYVTMPQQGIVAAQMSGGVGEVAVTIPQGVGVRIELNKGLGNVTMPTGYLQAGKIYTSPDYTNSANRVDLQINGGVGNIQILHK